MLTMGTFNFFSGMDKIKEDLFLGDHSDLYDIFLAAACIIVAVALIRISKDLTSGESDKSLWDLVKLIFLTLLVCNFTSFVLLPLDNVTSLVSQGIKANFEVESADRYIRYFKNSKDKSSDESLLSRMRKRSRENGTTESVKDFSLESNMEGLADVESAISGEGGRTFGDKALAVLKSFVFSHFKVEATSTSIVVTGLCDIIMNLASMVLIGLSTVLLCILGLFGPLSFAFSILPTFENLAWNWVGRYCQISLWVPFVYFIRWLYSSIMSECALTLASQSTDFNAYTIAMIGLIFLILLFRVPRLCSYIIPANADVGVGRSIAQIGRFAAGKIL